MNLQHPAFHRVIAAALALLMLFSVIPTTFADTDEPPRGLTMEELMEKFPHGKYWNGGDSDSWTETPCTHHGSCPNRGGCGCNSFMGLSIQCMGFAEKLGYDATGFNPRENKNGWYTYKTVSALNHLKPGDIVRRNGHSMYVIGVDGDTVTIADCNSMNRSCNIRWGGTVTKANLSINFEEVRSAPTELVVGYTGHCQKYASNGTVTTASETVLYSHPCREDILEVSTEVATAAPGSIWPVTALYLNTAGEYWYKTSSAGTVCYFYAGDGSFTGAPGRITLSDVSAPTNTQQGSGFPIRGIITADSLALSKVGAYIYEGDSIAQTPSMISEETLSNRKTYSIYDSAVDNNLTFGKLAAGSYTYVIKASVTNYYADSADLYEETEEVLLYQSTFTVSKAVTCSHSYESVEDSSLLSYRCGKCGFSYAVSVYATDYLKLCQSYLSIGTAIVATDTTLYSLPCTTQAYLDSIAVTDAPQDSHWQISGLLCNAKGQFWYKTEYEGTVCYLYAGDTLFLADPGKITLSDVSAPTNIQQGSGFPIQGTITSDILPLAKIGAYIYQGNTVTDLPHMTSEDTPTGKQTYRLRSSTVDQKLTFGKLAAGSYTYAVKASVTNHHANGNTLSVETNEVLLYQSTFSVTKAITCSHSYSREETVAGTCISDGLTTYICAECGYSYTITVFATGDHSFCDWEVILAPTCTEMGKAQKICSGCGLTQYQILPTSDHRKSAAVTEPTCTQIGYSTFTCADCGADLGTGSYTDPLGHSPVIDDAIAPTCTQSGLTEGVHCGLCGEILTAQQATEPLGHSYESVVTPPNAQSQGFTTHTCTICGDSYVDSYTEPSAPEAPALRFTSAYLTMESDLSVTFQVTPEILEAYDDIRLVFSLDGGHTLTLTESDCFAGQGNRPSFTFTGISPRHINATISATVYGTFNGVSHGYTMTYSAAQYCYNTLSRTSNGRLKTLIVDLLQYATAHQLYTQTNVETPANADLSAADLTAGTTAIPQMSDYRDTAWETVENPTARFKSAVLTLKDAVVIRCKLNVDANVDITKLTVRITTGSGQTWHIPSSQLEVSGSDYFVSFQGLTARQMRELVYLTICEDGKPVSNTLRYSIESYAGRNYASASDDLRTLILTMLRYGDSARAYAESK